MNHLNHSAVQMLHAGRLRLASMPRSPKRRVEHKRYRRIFLRPAVAR